MLKISNKFPLIKISRAFVSLFWIIFLDNDDGRAFRVCSNQTNSARVARPETSPTTDDVIKSSRYATLTECR